MLVGVVLAILIPLSISNESRKTVTVHYSVTGDARGVSISYSHWSNGDWAVSETTATRLPWRKDESSTGLVRGGTLTVTTGASGGTATCSVAVDDGKPRTARATGPFSTAGCDGFNS